MNNSKHRAIYNLIKHLPNDINVDIEDEKRNFFNTTYGVKRNNFKVIYKYVAAAVVIGVLASAYFLKDNFFETRENLAPIIVNNTIEFGTDKATLTLADGSNVVLEKGESFQTEYAISNGDDIEYKETVKTNIVYNYLTIPRGGKYQITLSDGTKVWLNADTQLKYPVAFQEGQTRQVELLYGEAYFDVTPSIDNKGTTFKVLTQSQEIEVLGTEFNIQAYKGDTFIHTTLVEGKVTVENANGKKVLLPNQQSHLNLNSNTILVKNVDPYNHVAWKDGVFSFDNKSLKNIMTTLSRWYDLDVVFENKALEHIEYVGVFGRTQSIKDILSTLISADVINTYNINNKTVTLK